MRKTLTLITTLLSLYLTAKEDCGETPPSKHFVVRHLEGSGIGYDHGYTSVDLFIASRKVWEKSFVPFLDLRGHLFNNSKFATNLGLGGRYIGQSRIWGGNIYYDYRNSGRKHYNQFAGGLESLGRVWDFRLNGYYPLGSKHSGFFNKGFDRFEGNCAILSAQREFALKGFNAEVGAHVEHFKKAPLYFAGGTYYLNGEGNSSWGGELRAVLTLLDHIRLEGETSYDNFYRWTGRGQISAIIPFGKRAKIKKKNSCHRAIALGRRAFQRVDRHEIIPVDEQRKTKKAYNPKTCSPYNFIFVNNKCNSDGTAESPYPLLTTAFANSSEGDIIYVFPGDGSPYSTNVSGGFQLLNSQSLLGSGISHPLSTQFGTIRIPTQSGTYPKVTNTSADSNVINLANNNEVAGMHVVGTTISNGINAEDGSMQVSGLIRENWIEISNGGEVRGINVDIQEKGLYVMDRNSISNLESSTSNAIGVNVVTIGANSSILIANHRISNLVALNSNAQGINTTFGGAFSNYTISNNHISHIESQASAGITTSTTSNGNQSSYLISHNRISDVNDIGPGDTRGIEVFVSHSDVSVIISHNRISDITSLDPVDGIFAFIAGGEERSSFNIFSNSISNCRSSTDESAGIFAQNRGNTSSFNISTNSISNIISLTNNSYGISANNSTGSSIFEISENEISFLSSSGTSNGILADIDAGTFCLVIADNFAPPVIQLTRGGGTFNIDPSSEGNNPAPTAAGLVIYSSCAP